MSKCEHKNTVFGILPEMTDYEYCLDCKQSRAIYEQDESEWVENKLCEGWEDSKARIAELEADLNRNPYLLEHGTKMYIQQLEAALNTKNPERHLKQLLDVISGLRADIHDKAALEIDATATIKDLKAQLQAEQWRSVEDGLPESSGMYQVVRLVNPYPSTRYYYGSSRKQWDSRDVVAFWKPISLPSPADVGEKDGTAQDSLSPDAGLMEALESIVKVYHKPKYSAAARLELIGKTTVQALTKHRSKQ